MEIAKRKFMTISFFILPALLFFFIFILIPVGQTVRLSFYDWNGIAKIPKEFVGLRNYFKMLQMDLFWKSIINNAIIIVLSIIIQIPIGLVIANILSKPLRGLRYFKLAFFMPYVLSATAVSLMWKFILHPNNGLLNIVLEKMGMVEYTRGWLSDPKTALISVILISCWQGLGLIIILLLAGIVSIPKEIIESSNLEGVNSFQYFIYIVIPYLWDVMKVIVIMLIIGGLKSFDIIYVLTQGGPFHSTEVLTTHMYREAFLNQRFGLGSAIAIFILVICLLLTVGTNKFMGNKREGGE
jgi:raffinose/stachyose/melibiose transport system permease protein